MIKAVKKLKKLLRKKKRKKIYQYQTPPYYHFPPPPPPPPPAPCYLFCPHTSTAQPSAPPLPPWLQPEQTHEENGLLQHYSLQDHLVYPNEGYEEIVVETSSTSPTLPGNASSEYSYQQYMEPTPVYGMPVVQVTRQERPAGFFDCFVKFAANLIGCVCPCFRIREAKEIIAA